MHSKTGILITNLGTPDAPTALAVRHYLIEFLSDPYVVEIPSLVWKPLLKGLIAPLRAKKSAEAYEKIWTVQGSPLLAFTQKIVAEIQNHFSGRAVVELGMRYGAPSLAVALQKLQKQQIGRLIVMPLYPQYSYAATGSTFAAIMTLLKEWRYVPELYFINQYYDDPLYIQALANSITASRKSPYLLFSFHGLPKKSITQGDPYYFQCLKTAALVAQQLQLAEGTWQVVFQSRFGRQQWLTPYCDKTLAELPRQGHKAVDVVCPGFPADCLETLEEIALRNKQVFLEAGGEFFNYIPALNGSSAGVDVITELLQQALQA